MERLTMVERAFLESVLKNEKRNAETFLKNNADSFEAYFVRNETLPFIESILNKIKL